MQNLNKILYFIDAEKRFGYAQFLNYHDQQEFGFNSSLQSVILIDTKTNYFNATRLADSLAPTQPNLINSKILPPIIELLETNLNTITRNPDQNSPNFISGSIRAKYTIAKSKNTQNYSGVYLHPNMLIYILSLANPLLMFKLSQLTFSLLVREGINKTLTLDKLIEDNDYEFDEDIGEHTEILQLLQTEPESMARITECCPKFDAVQYNKTKAYQASYSKQQPYFTSSQSKPVKVSKKQAIVVMAHYNSEYPQSSKEKLLSVELIDESNLKQYIEYHMVKRKTKKTEAEMEQSLYYNTTDELSTELLGKFISLQHVPFNFLELFYKSYSDKVSMMLTNIKNNEYVITDDFNGVVNSLGNYLLQYMDY